MVQNLHFLDGQDFLLRMYFWVTTEVGSSTPYVDFFFNVRGLTTHTNTHTNKHTHTHTHTHTFKIIRSEMITITSCTTHYQLRHVCPLRSDCIDIDLNPRRFCGIRPRSPRQRRSFVSVWAWAVSVRTYLAFKFRWDIVPTTTDRKQESQRDFTSNVLSTSQKQRTKTTSRV